MRDLLADWVDSANHARGIIACDMLPRGVPVFPADLSAIPERLPPVEVHAVQFDDPVKNSTTLAERARLVTAARMVTYFGSERTLIEVEQE